MSVDVNRESLPRQTIQLTGSDSSNSHAVYGREVIVKTSALTTGSHAGSNKVKISPIVSYDWAIKHYKGQQVAIDKGQQYVAYALKGKTGGIVRLIHRQLAERALIKGYQGLVADLAFSYSDKKDVLASIDDCGSLFVHSIELDKARHVVTTLLINISWKAADLDKRVFWCGYLPDETVEDEDDSDDDKTMLLSVVIDKAVHVMNVWNVMIEHGSDQLQYTDIESSITYISKHTKRVVEASFSPDGTAIATASEDGKVCFFQVDTTPSSPRCLYDWEPHGGQPLSMLHFLDDHLNAVDDIQFWKYVITGCSNNTELKVWSCEKWTCLQTIKFVSPVGQTTPCIIDRTDLSNSFLVMSDINSSVLYVLKLHQDSSVNTAHVSSISEFVLGAPCLSFAILSIKRKQLLMDSSSEDEDDFDSNDDDDDKDGGHKLRKGISVHLTAVQPKNLQDMYINFVPQVSAPTDSLQSAAGPSVSSSFSAADSYAVIDELSDLSASAQTTSSVSIPPAAPQNASADRTPTKSGSSTPARSVETSSSVVAAAASPAVTSPQSSVLLTPDAFTSSSPRPLPNGSQSGVDKTAAMSPAHSSLTQVTMLAEEVRSLVGPDAFEAGTAASTVSSMTLTPKQALSPSSVPLDTPLERKSASSAASAQFSAKEDDTAQQLDDLFNSLSSAVGSMPKPAQLSSFLTEEDILNQPNPPAAVSVQSSTPAASDGAVPLVTPIAPPSVSADPAMPSASAALQLTRSSSATATYDSNIWPQAPSPPVLQDDTENAQDTDESDTTDDSDQDPDQMSSDKESGEDEGLDVKVIEQEVLDECDDGQEEMPKLPPQVRESKFMQDKFTSHLEDMKASILTLNEMMMSQGKDINQLKSKESLAAKVDALSKQVSGLTSNLSTKLEYTVNSLKREQKTMQDRLISQTTNKLSSELKQTVDRAVSAELRKVLVPCMEQLLDPIKKDLHRQMSDKLTAADSTLKDSISRLVNNQATIERIGQAAGMAIQDVMMSAHKDSIQQQILPSYDASTRLMFNQLNVRFTDGLNDYMKQLDDHNAKLKSKQLSTQKMITASCDSAVEALTQAKQDLQREVGDIVKQEVSTQVKAALDSMKSQLIGDIRGAVQQVVSNELELRQRSLDERLERMRSAAATPAPDSAKVVDYKAQIDQLVLLNGWDDAFQVALTASNLDVVMYLIKKIPDRSHVFPDDNCLLSQPSLLSLIQQLSCGLSGKDIETKLSYLWEALNSLDVDDTITAEHMGKVVNVLKEKLTDYSSRNPRDEHKSVIDGIQQTIKSLLRQSKRRNVMT